MIVLDSRIQEEGRQSIFLKQLCCHPTGIIHSTTFKQPLYCPHCSEDLFELLPGTTKRQRYRDSLQPLSCSQPLRTGAKNWDELVSYMKMGNRNLPFLLHATAEGNTKNSWHNSSPTCSRIILRTLFLPVKNMSWGSLEILVLQLCNVDTLQFNNMLSYFRKNHRLFKTTIISTVVRGYWRALFWFDVWWWIDAAMMVSKSK